MSSASSSSRISDTSTLEFEHIPYDEYITRVQELVQQIWPMISSEQVTVERLRGGSFNRVIGFSFQAPEDSQVKQYILRIPRYEDTSISRNVASVKFVQEHTSILVPAITAFDITTNNPLKDFYMIQTRVAGQSLQKLYPLLTHTARCTIARQMGDVMSTLLSLKGPSIGSLALLDIVDGPREFMIETIQGAGVQETVPYSKGDGVIDVAAALTSMFEYRLAVALNNKPEPDRFRAEYMRNFITMTSELSLAGHLTDVPITLCHMDLEPRNILVSDADMVDGISGVIDWDSAMFAPAYLACRPPSWIWFWDDHDDCKEIEIPDTQLTEETRQLKAIFEEAAGPVYQRFAYQPQYRLARRLMYFALRHIGTAEQVKEVDALLKDWIAVQDGNSAIKLDEYDETDSDGPFDDSDYDGDDFSHSGDEEAEYFSEEEDAAAELIRGLVDTKISRS